MFDKSLANHNLQLGFNDTMKIYHKYEGDKLTFEKGELQKLVLISKPKIKQHIEQIIENQDYDKVLVRDFKKMKRYQELLLDDEKLKKEIKTAIETLGLALSISITKVYKKSSYLKSIRMSFNKIEQMNLEMIENAFDKKDFSLILDRKILVKYGYDLFRLMDKQKLLSMMILSDKDFFASLYLSTIIK